MRLEVPFTIRVYFRLASDIVYDAAVGNQIGTELLAFLDILFAQFLEGRDMYAKIRPENYSKYSLDLSKLHIKLTLGGEPDYTTGFIPPLFSNIEASFNMIYKDDKPYTRAEEERIRQLISTNLLHRSGRIRTHFTETSNRIFQGDQPSFNIWYTSDRNLNIQARTRRRAIQGISALPQNVTNIVANYAVGPKKRNNIYPRYMAIPPALSNQTLALPFEYRLALAEEARGEGAPQPNVPAPAPAPASEPKKKPWYKFWGGRSRKARRRSKRRTHTTKRR
jgi:hypothetical protein